jgi:polyhydroxyalkanoate synthesis regulator phasin
MRDAMKNYLALASGLTEVGRQRAVAASKALVAQGEAAREQVGDLAEDLLATSRNNRKLITALVRSEVDKAMARVGPATSQEVRKLAGRLKALETSLRGGNDDGPAPTTAPPVTPKPAKPTAAKPAKPAATKAAKPAAAKPAKPAVGKPAKAAAKPATPKPAKPAAAKPAKAAKPAAAKPAKPAKRPRS